MTLISLPPRKKRSKPKTDAALKQDRSLALYIAACVGIGVVALLLTPGSYSLSLTSGYWTAPGLLLLNILPIIALGLIFYGLFGRAQWGFFATALIVLALGAGNYWKITFRDSPLEAGDLLILREAANMAEQYKPYFDTSMTLTAAFIVIGTAALWILARKKRTGRSRLILAAVGVVLIAAMTPILFSTKLYKHHFNAAEGGEVDMKATGNYISHGFPYSFYYSIKSATPHAPDGYNEKAVRADFCGYADSPIPADKKVNVLAIMLESFSDFRDLNVPGLQDRVYKCWDRLEKQSYTGELIVNIFGAGTINTERLFLTGFFRLNTFRTQTNSYVWYFRSQGYYTEGMHPYSDWFYSRRSVNEALGFQKYYMLDDYFGKLTDHKAGLDYLFFPELAKTFNAGIKRKEPYFNFSVSYQGHGPYDTTVSHWNWDGPGMYVKNDGRYTDAEQTVLENYFGGLADTAEHLELLAYDLQMQDEPCIMVVFGDHKPSLGPNNSLYEKMGINIDTDTQEGFHNYFSTPYLIFANDAAKEVLGTDMQGKGPTLGPGFLMSEVFRVCGWKGPAYMKAIDEVAQTVSVIHSNVTKFIVNGKPTEELTEEQQAMVDRYINLEYYWRTHFAYDYIAQQDK